MVGYPSYGPESQNYFSTKSKVSKVSGGEARNSAKTSKPKPFSHHNGQNLNTTPKQPKTPSGQKQSAKHQLERKSSSPKTIPAKQSRHSPQLPAPHRATPSSARSSPPRSTVSPSRSSPSNFASSTAYQPPTPSSLPKPPVAWTSATSCQTQMMSLNTSLSHDPTTHLKLLLNVQDISA